MRLPTLFAAVLSGIRNTQGWDWPEPADARLVWLTDHGPSGELLRKGHDEVNVARAGDNLGWPIVYGCQARQDLVEPALSWADAVPPGGASVYRGTEIPSWRNALVIGSLGARHLHVVWFDRARVVRHEVYLRGEPPQGLGRLRDVTMGPDGHLYATTSNCDARGRCGARKDRIVRIRGGFE